MASSMDNDDLLIEILLRLPAKSLMRFNYVCKKWLSLISSDYFCHQHFLHYSGHLLIMRFKSQPSLILHYSGHRPGPDYFYWSPTAINGENVMIPCNYKILQACNGLLLLKSAERDIYHVYNPITKLSTQINPTYNGTDNYVVVGMALAFDPSKSPYYKIVCVMCYSSGDETCRIEVYDLERRSWKLNFEPFTAPLGFLGSYRYSRAWCEAQYWNNANYWWRTDKAAYYCFDIAKNEMNALSFPQSHPGALFDPYFQELVERLYYLALSFHPVLETTGHQILATVWELGGDGNSPSQWLSKHHDDLGCNSEGIGCCVRLMGHYSDGSLQMIQHHSRKMKMTAYNFVHKRSEYLVDFTAPPFDYKYHNESIYYCLKAFQFRETLDSV